MVWGASNPGAGTRAPRPPRGSGRDSLATSGRRTRSSSSTLSRSTAVWARSSYPIIYGQASTSVRRRTPPRSSPWAGRGDPARPATSSASPSPRSPLRSRTPKTDILILDRDHRLQEVLQRVAESSCEWCGGRAGRTPGPGRRAGSGDGASGAAQPRAWRIVMPSERRGLVGRSDTPTHLALQAG